MKLSIEQTDRLVRIDGTLCRVWKGKTEDGVLVHLFVLRLCVDDQEDTMVFDRQLVRMSKPDITTPDGGPDDGSWQRPG